MRTLALRLAGLVAALALMAGAIGTAKLVGRPPSGSYRVTALLGEAGQSLRQGSDVKVRGVAVGKVEKLTLDDHARAVATLLIYPDPSLPADVEPAVEAKTLLGEKRIELRPRGELQDGPRLQDGAVLQVPQGREPTELQDVLERAGPVLAAINGRELGAVVDAFGSLDQRDAEAFGRNIEVGSRLASFGADTANEQVDRIAKLANVTNALASAAQDFNRVNEALPRAASVIVERQPDLVATLDGIAAFSRSTSELLTAEEPTIRAMLAFSSLVGRVIESRPQGLSDLIEGIHRFTRKLGQHGGSLNDGTEHGWFRVFIGDEGQIAELCARIPPAIAQQAPGCVPGDPNAVNHRDKPVTPP